MLWRGNRFLLVKSQRKSRQWNPATSGLRFRIGQQAAAPNNNNSQPNSPCSFSHLNGLLLIFCSLCARSSTGPENLTDLSGTGNKIHLFYHIFQSVYWNSTGSVLQIQLPAQHSVQIFQFGLLTESTSKLFYLPNKKNQKKSFLLFFSLPIWFRILSILFQSNRIHQARTDSFWETVSP